MVKVKNSFQVNKEKFNALLLQLEFIKQAFPSLKPGRAGYSGGSEIITLIGDKETNNINSFTEDHEWDKLGKSKYIVKFKVGLILSQTDNRTSFRKFFEGNIPQNCIGVLEVSFSAYSKKPSKLLLRVFGEIYFDELVKHYKSVSTIKDSTIVLESLHPKSIFSH